MLIRMSFLLSVIVIVINGSILPSTIEIDLNEITKLHREFLERSPSIPAHRAYQLRCRAIVECCPDEEEQLYAMLTDGQFNTKCLGNGTKTARSSLSSSCMSTLHQLIQLTKEPIYEKYSEVLGHNQHRLNRIKIWKKQMKMICSKEELNAYYCDRNNMNRFKSCQRKILEMIAKENVDDDGTVYKTFVSQWEQEYAIDNQKLAKAFPRV